MASLITRIIITLASKKILKICFILLFLLKRGAISLFDFTFPNPVSPLWLAVPSASWLLSALQMNGEYIIYNIMNECPANEWFSSNSLCTKLNRDCELSPEQYSPFLKIKSLKKKKKKKYLYSTVHLSNLLK